MYIALVLGEVASKFGFQFVSNVLRYQVFLFVMNQGR